VRKDPFDTQYPGYALVNYNFRFKLVFADEKKWKKAQYDVNGYTGVYFIAMCSDPICDRNASQVFPVPRYNMSYYSYYYD
jgi:hypothetical protein